MLFWATYNRNFKKKLCVCSTYECTRIRKKKTLLNYGFPEPYLPLMGFQSNGPLDLWVFGPMGRQTYELLRPMIHTYRTNGPSDHRHCAIQTFNNTTKNEELKQYLFQIVELRTATEIHLTRYDIYKHSSWSRYY